MPFITIELPESLRFSFEPFAVDLHRFLAETLDTPVEKFKSKILRLPEVIVGEGQGGSYARLRLELLSGRDRQKLIVAGKELIARFKKQLAQDNPDARLRITCELHEIDRDLLFT